MCYSQGKGWHPKGPKQAEQRSNRNLMKYSKESCRAFHLDRLIPTVVKVIDWQGTNSDEKNSTVLVEYKWVTDHDLLLWWKQTAHWAISTGVYPVAEGSGYSLWCSLVQIYNIVPSIGSSRSDDEFEFNEGPTRWSGAGSLALWGESEWGKSTFT